MLLILSKDLLAEIISLLRVQDIACVAKTCSTLARVSMSEQVWKKVCARDRKLHYPYMQEYRLSYKCMSILGRCELVPYISFLTPKFDVAEIVKRCGYFGLNEANFLFPIPRYICRKSGAHNNHYINSDVTIKVHADKFDVIWRSRSSIAPLLPIVMTPEFYPGLIQDVSMTYPRSELETIVTNLKKVGYRVMSAKDNNFSMITELDAERYPDIFCQDISYHITLPPQVLRKMLDYIYTPMIVSDLD